MNTIAWLTRLLAFDTTSRHSNLQLIDAVEDFLVACKLAPWRSHNIDHSKANLFVTIPAHDGSIAGGTVLSGHTDVVPVDGQDWSSPPFSATVRGDKLYGRGACDMKGFIAACLHAVPWAQQQRLREPLHLALSYDEEIGCLGAPVMISQLAERGLSPNQCIIGEPTNMQMVVAHKGINVYSCTIHGHSAHSSLTPQGVNAIEYAARIIVFLQDLAHRLQTEYQQDKAFDVPFSTINIGRIHGGTAVNIIPNQCELQFDYRNLPTMDGDAIVRPLQQYLRQLIAQMQQIHGDADIVLRQLEYVPAMNDGLDHALYDLVAALVDDVKRHKVAFAAEGGHFQLANINTVICGPGSIAQAHKADEYIELSQLARCDRFLQQLIHSLSLPD